jgi:hypothetical protein
MAAFETLTLAAKQQRTRRHEFTACRRSVLEAAGDHDRYPDL